ncbi:MAG: 5-formyltetrahydrofolate cyclo-ligase [Propionibacteriales bacterium]|nr:5-formyltetrahydrofolate cyclo-ligase [Propionibacteriales bacterium]
MNPGAGEGEPKTASPLPDKSRLRAELIAARAARTPDPAAEQLRTDRALEVSAAAGVVAAYLARPHEPETAALLRALAEAGVRVLLPVLTLQPDWAWYAGPDHLAPGPFGISQPTGRRLGADALAVADWIWLPGLAGSPSGVRLGTGGGWYDRALLHARAEAVRGLLLFDDEVRDQLPHEPWDQPVDLIVTERRTITCTPRGRE